MGENEIKIVCILLLSYIFRARVISRLVIQCCMCIEVSFPSLPKAKPKPNPYLLPPDSRLQINLALALFLNGC